MRTSLALLHHCVISAALTVRIGDTRVLGAHTRFHP